MILTSQTMAGLWNQLGRQTKLWSALQMCTTDSTQREDTLYVIQEQKKNRIIIIIIMYIML